MRKNPLKYVFAAALLSVWFYSISASAKVSADDRAGDRVPEYLHSRGFQRSSRVMQDTVPTPLVPAVVDSLLPASEQRGFRTDTTERFDWDRLRTDLEPRTPIVSDSVIKRAAFLYSLKEILAPINDSLQIVDDSLLTRNPYILSDSVLRSIAPVMDSLQSYGIFPRPLSDSIPSKTVLDRLNDFIEDNSGIMEAVAVPEESVAQAPRPAPKPLLDMPMKGSNSDSLIYDLREKKVYIYNKGDVTYGNMNLKADFIRVNTETREILAFGKTEGSKNTRPEFKDGKAAPYEMDTITYNLSTGRAKIKGVSTKEGEGYLIGDELKKQKDNVVSIAGGKYTTCDHIDHPHFYLAMNRAKLIPNEKVIVGRSWFVMEDVPIVFPFLPFGFFPLSTGRSSGLIIPKYGEDNIKGFFLRDGGYYFAFNDHIDLQLLGGFYSLGSWSVSGSSRYLKRYKYNGSFNLSYSKDILGEKGSADYVNKSNYSIRWTHSQDSKARPGTTFSASVNMSSSGYNKYSEQQNIQQMVSTQTNSSISYSKRWEGSPFDLTASLTQSQNSQTSNYTFSFPNMSFNMAQVYPFKRKEASGRQKWYEKITLKYNGQLRGDVSVHERDLLKEKMFEDYRIGVNHSIPVSVSLKLLNFIDVSPSISYNERWYFKKIEQQWDPVENAIQQDTIYGFNRVWDYSMSVSMGTAIYGMYQFKSAAGAVRAIRHVITPRLSFSYTPNFGDPKYGYYKSVQSDIHGNTKTYSPYSGVSPFSPPGSRSSASLNISLKQNLEAKIRSKSDSTGQRIIKIIDDLTLSASYNFLLDSMNLSTISFSFRTPITKSYTLQVSGSLDPYQVDEKGNRMNKFMLRKGQLARLTRASTSFSYTFQSSQSTVPVANDVSTRMPETEPLDPTTIDWDEGLRQNPEEWRHMRSALYYDFTIPWNIGLSYSLSYSDNGKTKNLEQNFSFTGSITPTPKWGVNFGASYDFQTRKMLPSEVSVHRDLHCWEMSLRWIPIGYRRSWTFNIRVKSSVLRDIKYDKSRSFYDNLY